MKPIKLKFKGIGSYYEAAEIDFAALDSIFLICGETGAGKTTILDAMMFALYGKSSGGERNEIINCHYGKSDGEAYSVFVFELDGRQYRFTRRFVPKARALGYDNLYNCEYFSKDEEQWLPFFDNPKKDDLYKQAVRLIGLDENQFRQVAVLPQGKFEKLLTSSSEEKEKILGTIFDADKYARIAERLKEDADREKKRLEEEKMKITAMLSPEGFASAEQAAAAAVSEQEAVNALTRLYEAASDEKKEAGRAASEGALLSLRFDELDRSEEKLKKFLDGREENDRKKQTAERLSKEKSVLTHYKAYIEAKNENLRREKESAAAESRLSAARNKSSGLEALKQEHTSKSAENELMRSELMRLKGLSEAYESASPLKKAIDELTAEGKKLRQRVNNLSAQRDVLRTEIANYTAEAEHIEKNYADKLVSLYGRLKALEAAKKLSEELNRLLKEDDIEEKELKDTCLKLEKNTKDLEKAENEYLSVQKEFIDSLSSRLAGNLTEGTPCPVCGSIHHPSPCSTDGESISEEDVKAASQRAAELADKQSSLKISCETLKNRQCDRREKINRLTDEIKEADYSEETYLSAEKSYSYALSQQRRMGEIRSKIKEKSAETECIDKQLASANELLNETIAEFREKNAEYTIAMSRMDKNIPDITSLEAKISETEKLILEYDKQTELISAEVLDAAKALSACENAFESAEKEKKEACEKMMSAKSLLDAVLTENKLPPAESFVPDEDGIKRLEALKSETETFEAELSAAQKAHNEILCELEGKTRPDTDALKSRLEKAENKCRELDYRIRAGKDRISSLNNLAELSGELEKKYASDYEVYLRRNEFALDMTGPKGISFSRYVLGVMLQLVIDEANLMLADMLGGRFALKRRSGMKNNSKQGLELEVENTIEGSCASYGAAQLSGGEKFLISLVLGLSLSKVVQSRFGSVRIDAMFIDEGFGSLDAETLREAMNVIFTITGSRRSVGIISHVDKLKEEIQSCINVKKDGKGSRITIT